jgi:hypothetical protein
MTTTVKMPWGGKTMLAPGRSQRRVIPQSRDGLQGRGFFIPGGEPRFMATPSGSAVAEASASAKPTADRMADREGESWPVAESAGDSSGRRVHGLWAVACSDWNGSRGMNRRRSQSLREEDTSALTPALSPRRGGIVASRRVSRRFQRSEGPRLRSRGR